MKRSCTIFAVAAASLVIASLCFAQMTDTVKKDSMSDLTSIMNDMSGTIVKMAGMMKDVNPEHMQMMSGIMKDVSKEMLTISGMLGTGRISDRELEKMHVRMMKTQRILSQIEMKK